jgi:AcrR family transcriptional regulator
MQKQAETRRAVLEAAREVVVERGMERATLDEIATRAGLTIGAIYSNFDGKADLMISLLDERADQHHVPPFTGDTLDEALEHLARHPVRLADTQPDQCILSLEFMRYELRDKAAQKRRFQQRAALHAAATNRLEHWLQEHNAQLPMPSWQFTEALSMALWGLSMSRLIMGPELITQRFCTNVLRQLGGLTAKAPTASEDGK